MSVDESADQPALKGVVPTLATPFTSDGALDEKQLQMLISRYLDEGVHGICVAGSQGEFFALDEREHLRVLELATTSVAGRVPLYAGTGAGFTRKSIRLTQAAEQIGIDVALVITPYFLQPSQSELVEHYRLVAEATTLPVVLYNNPPRTAVNILPDTLVECMATASNIIGIKDSSGDVTQGIEYKIKTHGKAVLFSGRDTVALSLLLHGADGTISPAANVFPGLVVDMYDAFKKGEIARAARISDTLAPLRAAWAWGSFPVVIKEAMEMIGYGAGPTRAPIQALDDKRREDLQNVLNEILENSHAGLGRDVLPPRAAHGLFGKAK